MCSSTNAPSVLLISVTSETRGTAPASTVVPPGDRFSANAPFRSNTVFRYWRPALVRDEIFGVSWNVAVPLASAVYEKKFVRLSVLNPVLIVAKSTHSSRRHRSVSIRCAKSMPPVPRNASQLVGRQLAVPLPMNRLTPWLTVSEKNSFGVKARYPYRPLFLLPGPPSPLDKRPVVLLSVCGSRCTLDTNPVDTATSSREFGCVSTLARR